MEGGDPGIVGAGHLGEWGEGIIHGCEREEVIQVCGVGVGIKRCGELHFFNSANA